MQEFTFKPALLRRSQTWTVRDGRAMHRGGKIALDLSTAERGEWNEISYRGTRAAWLYLHGPEGILKIQCSDSGSGNDRATFLRYIDTVLAELETLNPDLRITISGGQGYRMAMFVIFMLAFVMGAFFFMMGAMGWVERGVLGAMAFGAGFMAVGLWFGWSFAPWRNIPSATPAGLRATLPPVEPAPEDAPEDDPT